jgi:hypothetical protein
MPKKATIEINGQIIDAYLLRTGECALDKYEVAEIIELKPASISRFMREEGHAKTYEVRAIHIGKLDDLQDTLAHVLSTNAVHDYWKYCAAEDHLPAVHLLTIFPTAGDLWAEVRKQFP